MEALSRRCGPSSAKMQREARTKISDIAFRHTDERVSADQLMAAVGMSEMSMEMADGEQHDERRR